MQIPTEQLVQPPTNPEPQGNLAFLMSPQFTHTARSLLIKLKVYAKSPQSTHKVRSLSMKSSVSL